MFCIITYTIYYFTYWRLTSSTMIRITLIDLNQFMNIDEQSLIFLIQDSLLPIKIKPFNTNIDF